MIQSNHDHDKHHDTLLQQVIMELQTLRMMEQQEQNEQQHRIITTTTKNHHIRDRGMKFPPACYQYILQYISGNQYCFDCQSKKNKHARRRSFYHQSKSNLHPHVCIALTKCGRKALFI